MGLYVFTWDKLVDISQSPPPGLFLHRSDTKPESTGICIEKTHRITKRVGKERLCSSEGEEDIWNIKKSVELED